MFIFSQRERKWDFPLISFFLSSLFLLLRERERFFFRFDVFCCMNIHPAFVCLTSWHAWVRRMLSKGQQVRACIGVSGSWTGVPPFSPPFFPPWSRCICVYGNFQNRDFVAIIHYLIKWNTYGFPLRGLFRQVNIFYWFIYNYQSFFKPFFRDLWSYSFSKILEGGV